MTPQDTTTTGDAWDQYGPAYDMPPFHGQPRTYMIASMPRSGSHMLGHLLHATGDLGSPLEYVHPRHLAKWQAKLGTEGTSETLRAVMARRTSPSGWFGVKAHWPQFTTARKDPALMSTLNVQDWIQITRDDKVAQAISLVIAKQTNAWISFHEAKHEPSYDFDAIAEGIRGLEKQEAAWSAYFAEQGISPYVVVYEELLADPARVVSEICTRLGVPVPAELPSPATARQATAINEEWHARYVADAARSS